jgi:hypothetical protein
MTKTISLGKEIRRNLATATTRNTRKVLEAPVVTNQLPKAIE